MKETTKEWLMLAEDDLIAAKKLVNEPRLTSLAAFHCQQCIEKCFKATIEETEKSPIKSHDLLRLQNHAEIQLSDSETDLLSILNEVYIDSRYPGDLGLLPQGKPTIPEIEKFILFCELIFQRIKEKIGN
jgi:HEPN domain-containing protein